jgi:hypothetical protein
MGKWICGHFLLFVVQRLKIPSRTLRFLATALLYQPFSFLPSIHKKERNHSFQIPTPSPWQSMWESFYLALFFRVEFWVSRSAGCVTWTRPGTSASPNIPSLDWMVFLRRAASPLAITSGKPLLSCHVRRGHVAVPKNFILSSNVSPPSCLHQVSAQTHQGL